MAVGHRRRRLDLDHHEHGAKLGFAGARSSLKAVALRRVDRLWCHRAPGASTYIRHRAASNRTLQGMPLKQDGIAMVFKLAQAAEKSWRGLDGNNQLPKVATGVKFIDGIEDVSQQPLAA